MLNTQQSTVKMEKSGLVNGLKVSDYMIILNPGELVSNKITHARKEIAETFGVQMPLRTRPKLTLATFSTFDAFESKIKTALENIAKVVTPFKVHLKNYNFYANSTLFVNVENKYAFLEVLELLKQCKNLLAPLPTLNVQFASNPKLLISSTLAPLDFIQIWGKWHNRRFTASFIASEFLLVKRFTNGQFNVIGHYKFQNMPIDISKDLLFA